MIFYSLQLQRCLLLHKVNFELLLVEWLQQKRKFELLCKAIYDTDNQRLLNFCLIVVKKILQFN